MTTAHTSSVDGAVRDAIGAQSTPLGWLHVHTRFRREEFIFGYCTGKSVLHLGCADWPFTRHGLATGELLHAKLVHLASHVTGVDASQEGVGMLARAGYEDVVVGDVERLSECLPVTHFDVVILGEILEHLANPGNAVSSALPFLSPQGVLVASVPNAQSLKGVLRGLVGRECVHADHVAYYSAAVLEALMARHGLRLLHIGYYAVPTRRLVAAIPSALCQLATRVCPRVADGVVAAFSLDGSDAKPACDASEWETSQP